MTPIPVTLLAAAVATAINLWLGARISKFRRDLKVSIGDGGREPLLRRMRAQANFIENAPLFLILLGGLELSGGNSSALTGCATLFMLGRVTHAVGMDGGERKWWRASGMTSSTAATLVLMIWAVVVSIGPFLRG
jgi:uncharacterized membrane protein YecN with MAPEG domain